LFYNAADLVSSNGLTSDQLTAWTAVLSDLTSAGSDKSKQATVFVNAGDSVMQRLYTHLSKDDFECDEQIDKVTGAQTSAQNLTWS